MIKKIAIVLLMPVLLIFSTNNSSLLASSGSIDSSLENIGENADITNTKGIAKATRVVAPGEARIYHTVSFLDVDGNIDFSLEVAHGDSIEVIPDSEWDEGIFDYWSNAITSERLTENTPIYEDATYKPNYIYIEWLITNALDDVGLTLDDINPETFSNAIDYIKAAQNS